MSDCDGNPFNELSDSEFLRYLAQNDYNIDGGYLPEGVRLFAAADNIKSLEIRYDELWQRYKRLAQMSDELAEQVNAKPVPALDTLAQLDEELGLQ
jgi:hypothetical protein